jgi:hypothetical protein
MLILVQCHSTKLTCRENLVNTIGISRGQKSALGRDSRVLQKEKTVRDIRLDRIISVWILTLVVGCLFDVPNTFSETLWQIGTFNFSSGEFNTGKGGPPLFGQRFPKGELVYGVGKSNPDQDWPAYQPGSANGRAGFARHPYTIQFDLADVPHGLVTLKVSLLVESARTPRLGVEINGHRALFYRHPLPNYVGGDRSMVVNPTASADTISAEINPAFLLKGTNKLVLTAIDEPAERDDFTSSALFYDAIALEHNPNAQFEKGRVTAEVTPTVFYVRKGEGLTEWVDVLVRSNQALASGQLALKLGTQTFTQKLSADREFGEEVAEFAVPDFPPNTPAEVTAKIGGKLQRFPFTVSPAKKWLLYVVPHEHLDVGYSDFQAKVSEVQSRAIDEAIEMIQTHPEFRYSLDGYWCVEEFMAGRTPAQRAKFLELVKEKKIIIPAQEASLLTGFASLEVLFRSLYGGFQFNQKNGGSFDYANITDVPSYSWSYASILADAGLKYFAAASDNDNGPILINSRLNEKSPFWWEGPDGERILMWYSRSYLQVAYLFGLPPFLPAGRDSLPIFLQPFSRPDYKSDAVLLFGTQVENTDLYPQVADLVANWNQQYAYPKMQFSGFAEALEHIGGQLGDSIPIVRGDGGPFWEFGNASDARYVAMERANEQRALSAEKFSTISTLTNPGIQPDRARLERLWRNMVLFDEHTWTADRSVSDPNIDESKVQIAVKEHLADDARMDVDYLLRRHLAAIAGSIHNRSGTLIVFNPLNWKRSSLVEYDLRQGTALLDLTTKKEVPYEILSRGGQYLRIRFLAEDVPPVGYKCYARISAASEPPRTPRISGEVLENAYYRLTLDAYSGAVRSIIDKQMNEELVNTSSPYRFDQYLYVTGGDQFPNRIQEFSSSTPMPALDIDAANAGRLVSVTQQPYGLVAKLQSSALNTPNISTEIILFDGEKKILFTNRVNKSPFFRKEAVYFAFPFRMERPHIRYDLQNGFVDPVHDQMPGAGKEWFSVQHWVEAFKGNVSVAILSVDAPLITLGDIVRGKWPTDFALGRADIFSYAMNNYYFTNWPAAQGGDFTFRYVLTSGPDMSPDFLSRLGREETAPLETDEITSQDKAVPRPEPLPADQTSFLETDQSNVALVTWKLAEDGEGMILRFLELGGREGIVNVRIPLLDAESAWSCNAMEQKGPALPVSSHGFSFPIKKFQIVTVRVKGTPAR